MGVSTPLAAKANGLSTVLDVVLSPREAFERLREAPTWGWAFLVAAILAMIGGYLATPATVHAVQTGWAAQAASNPQMAQMSAAQQQRILNFTLVFVRWGWLMAPIAILVGALAETLVMLLFKAVGRSAATFKELWCASMNTLVVGVGVYNIVNAMIALVRGPQSYNTMVDAFKSLPSLAWLVPHAPLKLLVFLSAFNVISMWGAVLLAYAMFYGARVSKVNAGTCALVVTALAGLYFSLNVH